MIKKIFTDRPLRYGTIIHNKWYFWSGDKRTFNTCDLAATPLTKSNMDCSYFKNCGFKRIIRNFAILRGLRTHTTMIDSTIGIFVPVSTSHKICRYLKGNMVIIKHLDEQEKDLDVLVTRHEPQDVIRIGEALYVSFIIGEYWHVVEVRGYSCRHLYEKISSSYSVKLYNFQGKVLCVRRSGDGSSKCYYENSSIFLPESANVFVMRDKICTFRKWGYLHIWKYAAKRWNCIFIRYVCATDCVKLINPDILQIKPHVWLDSRTMKTLELGEDHLKKMFGYYKNIIVSFTLGYSDSRDERFITINKPFQIKVMRIKGPPPLLDICRPAALCTTNIKYYLGETVYKKIFQEQSSEIQDVDD